MKRIFGIILLIIICAGTSSCVLEDGFQKWRYREGGAGSSFVENSEGILFHV